MDGIITLEDILKEIVGNIYDEFDELNQSIQKIDDDTYVVDALIQIQDLNRYFNVNIKEESDTLSGLIIESLGYIPRKKIDDLFIFGKLEVKIKSLKKNRVDKVFIKKIN